MRNEVRHPAYQKLQSADGRGPFDPRAPLLQSKGAVKSNAFDPIEKPGGGSGGGGGGDEVSTERVQHIRTMLMAQAQETNAAEEEAPLRRPTRTRGAVDPALQARADGLSALLLNQRGGAAATMPRDGRAAEDNRGDEGGSGAEEEAAAVEGENEEVEEEEEEEEEREEEAKEVKRKEERRGKRSWWWK